MSRAICIIVLECLCVSVEGWRGGCMCSGGRLCVHMCMYPYMTHLCVDLCLQSLHMAKPHRESGLRENCVGEGCVQQGVDLEADIHIPGLRSQLHDY